jgi:HSP20 family protein
MKNKEISKSAKSDYLTVFKDLENRMENLFQEMWEKNFLGEKFPALKSMPKMDVIDRKKDVVVKAELPGFRKSDLDVSITNNQLVIKAKTSQEKKEEKGDYYRKEISKNEVYRSTLLPGDVDDSKIKTSFKNGMLKLTIPKKKNSSRKTVKVK